MFYPKRELCSFIWQRGCDDSVIGWSEEWSKVNIQSRPCMYGNLKSILCHLQELKLIGLDIPHFAADLPLNRCKNRYTNILPCKIVNSAGLTHIFQRSKDD